MKKLQTILIIIIFGAIILAVFLVLRNGGDKWICQNGLWEKQGNPLKEMPFEICGEALNNEIIVVSPLAGESFKSPLLVKGEARGNWFFEADFPIELVDLKGNQIIISYVSTKDDWMTTDFVEFEREMSFDLTTTTKAMLILSRDNPSGLPEHDRAVSLPVILLPSEKITIQVFFNNNNLDPEASCNQVFAIERSIFKTEAIARAALNELLKGINEQEKNEGYFTSVNQGVEIQGLTIENGIAKVDFNEQLEFQVGGSCRVSAIRAQIRETLKQFPTVEEVIISINGRTQDILQP